MGFSPWGHKESETTEQLTLSNFHYTDSQSVDMLFAGCLLFLPNFLLPYSSKSMPGFNASTEPCLSAG